MILRKAGSIVIFDAAAQRVGEQLRRYRGDELIGAGQQIVAQIRRSVQRKAVGRYARSIDLAGSAFAWCAIAGRIEILQREAERVHDLVAAGAGRSCRDAPPSAGASSRSLPFSPLLQARATERSAAAAAAAMPRMFSKSQLPRMVGAVRVA